MLRLLADENLNHDLIRSVLRRMPSLDLVRAQDVGLREVDDPSVLEGAAQERRIILTHDVNTIEGRNPSCTDQVFPNLRILNRRLRRSGG